MKPFVLFHLGRNPWANGLLLAALNVILAGLSIGSFLGVLCIVSWLNQLRLANNGASAELPFPYAVLMLLYAIMFPIAWIWFGRRLPNLGRERTITALVGSAPLFGLSLLGYASAIGILILDEVNPGDMSAASFFVFGAISTLILCAGLTSVGLISLVKGSAT